jgi:prepilin-type N-terminal cleavage/methylation domain-containing protein
MLKGTCIQKKCIHHQAAFTLIELLVVIFIISLLSGLVLASHRSGQKKYALSQASQRLVSDLRRSQNMAMSGVDIAGQYCGYGIYAEKGDSFYIFYGDESADCETSNNKYTISDEIIETVNLPSRIKVNFLSPSSNKLDVFFKPPEPTTFINGQDTIGLTAIISLVLEGTSLAKQVSVTTTGLIQSN